MANGVLESALPEVQVACVDVDLPRVRVQADGDVDLGPRLIMAAGAEKGVALDRMGLGQTPVERERPLGGRQDVFVGPAEVKMQRPARHVQLRPDARVVRIDLDGRLAQAHNGFQLTLAEPLLDHLRVRSVRRQFVVAPDTVRASANCRARVSVERA